MKKNSSTTENSAENSPGVGDSIGGESIASDSKRPIHPPTDEALTKAAHADQSVTYPSFVHHVGLDPLSYTPDPSKPWSVIKNPHIRLLCERLQHLPEWLAARERKRQEEKEFRRRVWEKACRDAGFIK